MEIQTEKPTTPNQDRLLTLDDVLAIVPVCKTTLWAMRKDPACNFPKARTYGNSRRRFWIAAELQSWIEGLRKPDQKTAA